MSLKVGLASELLIATVNLAWPYTGDCHLFLGRGLLLDCRVLLVLRL